MFRLALSPSPFLDYLKESSEMKSNQEQSRCLQTKAE
jgi:hypothetical protein